MCHHRWSHRQLLLVRACCWRGFENRFQWVCLPLAVGMLCVPVVMRGEPGVLLCVSQALACRCASFFRHVRLCLLQHAGGMRRVARRCARMPCACAGPGLDPDPTVVQTRPLVLQPPERHVGCTYCLHDTVHLPMWPMWQTYCLHDTLHLPHLQLAPLHGPLILFFVYYRINEKAQYTRHMNRASRLQGARRLGADADLPCAGGAEEHAGVPPGLCRVRLLHHRRHPVHTVRHHWTVHAPSLIIAPIAIQVAIVICLEVKFRAVGGCRGLAGTADRACASHCINMCV